MPKPPGSRLQIHPRAPHPLHLTACLRKASLGERIFRFNPIQRRLSNAVAELGTRCPCKSLMQRLCCRETLCREGFDAGCGRDRKSITAAKIRKDAFFPRSFKCVARMERSVIRDCREASMPSRISFRSIQVTLAASTSMPRYLICGSMRSAITATVGLPLRRTKLCDGILGE